MAKNWLILGVLLASVIRCANADSIAADIKAIHSAGLKMTDHIEHCLLEMKDYQDVEHKGCKAFNEAADIYMAARDRTLEYAFGKGVVKRNASPLEHMAAIGIIAKDAGLESPYGVVLGWQAMDRYLDQLEILNR